MIEVQEQPQTQTPRADARIRVLHIITRLIVGGASELVRLIVRDLDPDRFRAEIACGRPIARERDAVEAAREEGIVVHVVPELVRPVSPYWDLRAMGRLRQMISSGRYDIIHTHTAKAGFLGRQAAHGCGTRAVIHHVHGWGSLPPDQDWLSRRLFLALERKAARWCQRLVTVSHRDQEKGLRWRIGRPEQYRVIPPGIDLLRFRPRSAESEAVARRCLGIPAEAFVVGTVGRVARQKAPFDFVEVARRVAAVEPHVRFVWVGDGPLLPKARALAERCGVSDRIIWAGFFRSVEEILPAFDVFLLLSRWEGLPLTLLEAMAVGVPVVATAVDGSAEVIQSERTGLLIPPGGCMAAACQTLRLRREPELGRSLAQRALAEVSRYFAPVMVRSVEEVYEELLSGTAPCPAVEGPG